MEESEENTSPGKGLTESGHGEEFEPEGIEMKEVSPTEVRHENDGLLVEQERRNHFVPEDSRQIKTLRINFIKFTILLAAIPASALACLGLATAELGNKTGAWQSGILYLSYTLSSVSGSTVVVSRFGSRSACTIGAALFCVYMLFFWIATLSTEWEQFWAWTGAGIGGAGAGILWTAQGVYFAEVSQEYSGKTGRSRAQITSELGGIFAFWLLLEETVLDASSTLLTRFLNVPWSAIFGLYALVAILCTVSLQLFVDPPNIRESDPHPSSDHPCRQMSAAVDLLISDRKTKYLIGFNFAFGMTSAFLNSFVSGQVVPVVLDATYVGVLVAIHGAVAAVASLVFGRLSSTLGKGIVMVLGSMAFGAVALPFLLVPSVDSWTSVMLIFVYSVQGIGRASFEGSFRATFADWFPDHKEGAFANIILQNGVSTGAGYLISLRLDCLSESKYCMKYRDGTLHDLWTFSWLVIGSSFVGIIGYGRAAYLYRRDYSSRGRTSMEHSRTNPSKPRNYKSIAEMDKGDNELI